MADLMLTGRALSAAEGERVNLCQYVVPAGQSMAKAKELANAIASNAAATNWGICAALPRVNDMSHDDGLFMESLIGHSARSGEGRERIQSFLGGQNKVVAPGAGETGKKEG
jgi:enoyl-CoA hydratase/carnithine racemase